MTKRASGPDVLYASLSDLERREDWPGVTPSEECCDDLEGGAVRYVLETWAREAAPDMLETLEWILNGGINYNDLEHDVVSRLQANIAKAKGTAA